MKKNKVETTPVILWWGKDHDVHGGIPADAEEANKENGSVKVHYVTNNKPRVMWIGSENIEWRLTYVKNGKKEKI